MCIRDSVPTPLACVGVGLFVDETLSYSVLEKTSTESFQVLWIEISFVKKKNVTCGVLYRQHNSPENFLKLTWKFTSTGKNLRLLGDFNLCVQKNETSNYSRDFLLALQSCYLLPTIDKPTRVHINSASLIDNIFVNFLSRCLSAEVSLLMSAIIFRSFVFWHQQEIKLNGSKLKNAIFRISIPIVLTATLLRSTGVASLKRTQIM